MKKFILGTLATLILAVGALTVYALTLSTSASDVPPAVMWENDLPQFDNAEVYEARTLVEAGAVAPDELPPFALWSFEELLEELGHFVEVGTRHNEMSRDELVARVSRVRVLQRLELAAYQDTHTEFFEWVRENYTEQDIAIYVELGASQQLVDRLVDEISLRLQREDAEVYRLRALNDAGASADEFEPFALWTRAELLERIGMATDVEVRHQIMSRDELVLRATVAVAVIRANRLSEADFEGTGFFEWTSENYTEENIAIYEEMSAPQWLINRLRAEISLR